MDYIAKNISQITALVEKSSKDSHQNGDTIKLLAVSKGQNVDKIRAAWRAGVRCFDENYLQEALKKMVELADLEIEWHFIGAVQGNKAGAIAEHFSWVHTIDRARVADLLAKHRPRQLPPLNVCIQVNIDAEASKAGATTGEVAALARHITGLPALCLRGLTVIPKPRAGLEEQREPFRRARQLLEQLRKCSPELRSLDTLSMGMSNDVAAAVMEGATIIRVGTALFGPREIRR